MNLRALLASALLLPACAAQRASTPPTSPEPSTAQAPAVAPPTGLQREGGPIGTPHPFIFQSAAMDGRWVVACQAREDTNNDGKVEVRYGHHGDPIGDAVAPYLFLEPGAGERLEDFLLSDKTNRYLVVVRGGSLRLLDTYTHQDTELAASGSYPESRTPGSALPVSFSRDGKRLLLVRSGPDQKNQAVLIHLEDGRQQVVPHGPGELGQARLTEEGTWAVFGVLTQDTDGDGKLTWPRLNTSLSPRFCRGRVRSSSQRGFTGDRPDFVLGRIGGGPVYKMGEVLRSLGDAVLRRDEQGALVVENAQGQRTEWVPASCRGALLHVDVEREQLLVVCEAQGNALELHGAWGHQSFGLSVEPPGYDSLEGEPTRLHPVTPAPQASGESTLPTQHVVDLEKRTVQPVPVPGWVHYTDGTRALVVQRSEQEQRLWFVDMATGEKRELGKQETSGLKVAGSFVHAAGLLVDMRTGQLVGPVKREVKAVDTQGRVLRTDSDREEAPRGPVQWSTVTAPR